MTPNLHIKREHFAVFFYLAHFRLQALNNVTKEFQPNDNNILSLTSELTF